MTNEHEAALALHRFGLGPRAGAIAAIASDPRGALLAELEKPGVGRIDNPELMSAVQASRAAFEARAARQAQRITAERSKKESERLASMGMGDEMAADAKAADAAPAQQPPAVERQIFLKEVRARLDAALDADLGFVERLVWFWSNHFCVSGDTVPNMLGGYEREAIRPHVLGRFVDMLLAVEGHPAMLIYLSNAASIGPNSVAGINRTRGLNENLAREILELHTLGVRTGYTQDDVTRFANVLTGWTVKAVASDPEHGVEFIFNPRMHEPGPQQVLGKIYQDGGIEQGRQVLIDLARHPATATHIATKLARHFVADVPPPPLVEGLAQTFRDSDGDLKQLAKALVAAPEAWSAPRDKLKRPSEWVVGMLRASGMRANTERFARGQTLLGEPMWRPGAPQGFAEDEASWIDGMGLRLDVANNFAERIADRVEPDAVLATALGPLASPETRQAVARAETRPQALALLFMSPEFQRR
ncbi:MAG TPA: DUF1800 family protein [Xanthobacteraceae bacterium]|jgi:uncharacterized protein (DUF1800 family)|nr:DUF1800 family protein [Xanthobacteraceae bacterium]